MSSTISSSLHLRVDRLLTNGNNFATSIAGRFAAGAFTTKFYINVSSLFVPLVRVRRTR